MRILIFIILSPVLIICGSGSPNSHNVASEKKTEGKISKMDSVDLKKFWNENVIPIIEKDTKKLARVINFPLKGDWSFDMGFEKAEEVVNPSEFFSHFEKLFNQTCIEKLKELKYHDTQVYVGEGYTQLIVSNGWELPYMDKNGNQNHREGGIILKFKKINNRWQLFSIDSLK